MFAHASAADKPNNNVFSLCSIADIERVLNSLYEGISKPWPFVGKYSGIIIG